MKIVCPDLQKFFRKDRKWKRCTLVDVVRTGYNFKCLSDVKLCDTVLGRRIHVSKNQRSRFFVALYFILEVFMTEDDMENKNRKNDVILILILLVTALVAYLGMNIYQGSATKNAVAYVTIDGVEYGSYPLEVDVTERIELPDGSYNLLFIKDGKADVIEASCPDGICVNHRAIDKRGESIVCLPNKVVVEIINGEEAEIDFVVK